MDHYYKMGDGNIHAAQIIVALTIVTVVGCLLAIMLKRSLRKDFANLELSVLRKKEKRSERARAALDARHTDEME